MYVAELGGLGNYPGSPFLPSDSEILLDSPDHEDIGELLLLTGLLKHFSRKPKETESN